MKKSLKITAIICVVIVALVVLVGCGPKGGLIIAIGLKAPTATPTTAVNSDMDGVDMLMAAVDNYYGADFVASVLSGNVETTVMGGKVTQAVLGRKIREGKFVEDFASDNSNYFVDNRSYSFAAKLYEETLIKSGDIKYRNVSNPSRSLVQSKSDMYDISVNDKVKWNDIEDYGSVMADYITAKSSDPRKIWAYLINEDTIKTADKPSYNAETQQYSFKVVMDIALSTEEYKDVMIYQLESNAGMSVSGLDFTQLEFNVYVWESGFLARLEITESYKMKLAGIINSEITLNSTQYFSYNPNEAGYKMSDYINQF